jgi:hypothetical protein
MDNFPGYLGWTSRGVIAIHADWPIYPLEHGWEIALMSLGNFPIGTNFALLDDIDQCVLLLAEGYGRYKDPFGNGALHVAIWHEDLLEAADMGIVSGVERLTERGHVERWLDKLRSDIGRTLAGKLSPDEDPLQHLGYRGADRRFVSMPYIPLTEFDDEHEIWVGMSSTDRVLVTDDGWQRLYSLLADSLEVPPSAKSRIEPLLHHELYDTALRELGALMETRMRQVTQSSAFGSVLVDRYVDQLTESNRFITATVKMMRGELRTAFTFVRNEFAHNVIDLPRPRALALISRLCRLLSQLEELKLET